jgi:hypothetical protein
VTEAEIVAAIGNRLEAGTSLPIVWPNKAASPAMPYLMCDIVPVSRRDPTIAGGAKTHIGFAMISVVAEKDSFATEALNHADAIAALFPFALRISTGTGKVLITKPPEVLRGYPDDTAWRQPVRVAYEAA